MNRIEVQKLHRGTFYFDILKAANRNKVLTRTKLDEILIKRYDFVNPKLKATRRSGGSIYDSHLSWDIYALKNLGLIYSKKRGSYILTTEGRAFLRYMTNDNPVRFRYAKRVNTEVARCLKSC